MDPNSFHFNVKMPADARLVGAVLELTKQMATYAKLPSAAGRSLSDHVAAAAEGAIATIYAPGAPIKFRFDGVADAIEIALSCEAEPSTAIPSSSSNDHVSVNWVREGSLQTCHIRQRRTS